MAQPIGMKACLISIVSAYCVENSATNKNTGVLNFYKLLKLAVVSPYSTENGASNRIQVIFCFEQSLNYYDVMFINLLHCSTYFLQYIIKIESVENGATNRNEGMFNFAQLPIFC